MSQQPTYTLKHILLMDSSFSRTWNVDFDNPEFANNVTIDVGDGRSGNQLMVDVSLDFSAGIKDENHINAKIKMLGVFETDDIDHPFTANFAQVNAPAIIFPFIREHLGSLTMKAGLSPILLAPVNFVNRHAEAKASEQKT